MKKTILLLLLLATALTNKLLAQQAGDLDKSFGGDGIVSTQFGTFTYDDAYSVNIQLDGKIVVAGNSDTPFTNINSFAVARYNDDGSLDNSFGTGGLSTADFGQGSVYAYSSAIQLDGKIVLAGTIFTNGSQGEIALIRFASNGKVDSSFGVNGKVTASLGEFNSANAVALLPDGKIVVAGTTSQNSISHFVVMRFNNDGTLDYSFSSDGKLSIAFQSSPTSNFASAYSIALQPDGKIIVAGDSQDSIFSSVFAMARINSDGILDTTFGFGGKVLSILQDSYPQHLRSTALLPDGKILAVGYGGSSSQFFLTARFNSNGTIDSTFGTNGVVKTLISNEGSSASSVALQSDNKFVVGGSYAYQKGFYWDGVALVRYNSDGTLDSTFGENGIVADQVYLAPQNVFARSIALQQDGKIVTAGSVWFSQNNFIVIRYLAELNIGIVNFSASENSVLIYPNPISKSSTLEYTLPTPEIISIRLLDLQGRILKTFMENENQVTGNHQVTIDLDNEIPSGSYLIVIATANGGKESIKVIK